jgi:hypothetical protein
MSSLVRIIELFSETTWRAPLICTASSGSSNDKEEVARDPEKGEGGGELEKEAKRSNEGSGADNVVSRKHVLEYSPDDIYTNDSIALDEFRGSGKEYEESARYERKRASSKVTSDDDKEEEAKIEIEPGWNEMTLDLPSTIAGNESAPVETRPPTRQRPNQPRRPTPAQPGAFHSDGRNARDVEAANEDDNMITASNVEVASSTRLVEAWTVEKHGKRRMIIALVSLTCILVGVAIIGVSLGIYLPRRNQVTGTECTFCFDRTSPPDLETSVMGDSSQTCLSFMEDQSALGLKANDAECHRVQTVAWKFCGCPTLPPDAADTLCDACEDPGEVPVALNYANIEPWIEDVTKSMDCTCANPVVLKQTRNVSRTLSGNAVDDPSSPQFAALEWTARDASNRVSSETNAGSNLELERRYLAATLYYSLGGDNWTDSYSFLSPDHVCRWNGFDEEQRFQGIGCNEQEQIKSISLSK